MKREEIRAALLSLKIPRHEAKLELKDGVVTFARLLGFVADDRIEIIERSRNRTVVMLVRDIVSVELVR